MDRRSLLGRGLAAIAAGLAGPAAAAPARRGAGWTTLFDGRSLDAWSPIGDANWRLAEGAALADMGNGYLVSKRTFGDFELKAEFWVDETANSGIFIRCTNPLSVSPATAYEVNIYEKRPDQSYATGAIVDVAKVATVPKTAGRWNTMEISAKGPIFSVWVNGERTVDKVENMVHAHGRIALQRTQGVVKFRKVLIKAV